MYSKILYHGTHNKKKLLREGFDNAMFLTGTRKMKHGIGFYATEIREGVERFGDVVKVHVTLENPYIVRGLKDLRKFNNNPRMITDYCKSCGHDGIIIHDGFEVVVFDAKNIKVV